MSYRIRMTELILDCMCEGIAVEPPKIPDNETQRQRAVDRLEILDTGPEDAFDRITRMTAKIMDTPIACVTIVDKDRQWFKSSVGLDVQETNRRISFCGHAINSKSLFIVTNAREDPRFADNPLVTGAPKIAFYIGVPVMSSDGYAVGTLCAISDTPKDPSDDQQNLMKDMAKVVEGELHLREQATTDELSGLINRRQFILQAQMELGRAQRSKRPIALLMLDVDKFKEINDALGHAAGDKIISAIGEELPRLFKRPGDSIARLGGDEFIAILSDTDINGATTLGEKTRIKLYDAIRKAAGIDDKQGKNLSVSIGVVVLKPAKTEPEIEDVMKMVDSALYESKHKGRNRVTVRELE